MHRQMRVRNLLPGGVGGETATPRTQKFWTV